METQGTVDDSIHDQMEVSINDNRSLDASGIGGSVHGINFVLPFGGIGGGFVGEMELPPKKDENSARACVDYYSIVIDNEGTVDMFNDSNFFHTEYDVNPFQIYNPIKVDVWDEGRCE